MLLGTMRTLVTLGLLQAWCLASAQVSVNTPISFTGSEENRAIDSLGVPATAHSLITVEGSVRSEWAWANATVQGTNLVLDLIPAMENYRDGSLIRFLVPAITQVPTSISVGSLPPLDLVRPDGEVPANAQLISGRVCEVMQVDGRFHLLNSPEIGCPPGFLRVNENYCIESSSSSPVDFYTAADVCAARGGSLCTWSEHAAACTLLQGQFTNMFVDWEWVDDTSNHAHTAVQVGRTSCSSQRAIITSLLARKRCCFHLR